MNHRALFISINEMVVVVGKGFLGVLDDIFVLKASQDLEDQAFELLQ